MAFIFKGAAAFNQSLAAWQTSRFGSMQGTSFPLEFCDMVSTPATRAGVPVGSRAQRATGVGADGVLQFEQKTR